MATEKAIEGGYDKTGRVVEEGDYYYGKLDQFAMKNCTFYECNECQEPFFGGMQDCEQAMEQEDKITKESLLCKQCKSKEMGEGQNNCALHGNAFIDYKCMYCCNVAQFVCCGMRYFFCQACHNDAMNGGQHKPQTDCCGGDNCPLGVAYHPKASDDPAKA